MSNFSAYLSHFKGAELRSGRKAPVQREATEQLVLTSMARQRWWWPGYRHHEQARVSGREAKRLKDRGVKPGWPDVTLHIPSVGVETGDDWYTNCAPVLAALELKTSKGRATDAQLDTLRQLELCGYKVTVAFSAEGAIAWLDEIAGLKPEVMPEGW